MSASEDGAVIRVRGLVTRFGAQTIHDGLDLDVRRGEVLGVVGGSGTGKSVLLKAIIGLVRPAVVDDRLEPDGQRGDRQRDVIRAADPSGQSAEKVGALRGAGLFLLCPTS